MSDRNERLFSYGTLQQEEVQRTTFGRRLEGAPDELVGFEHRLIEITDADVVATSGKTHHPIVVRSTDASTRIQGTVFLVTRAELEQADAYEVDDYERIETVLASGTSAWVYVMRQPQA